MGGEKIVSIFSGRQPRLARSAAPLKPIGAEVRLRPSLRLEIIDTTGTSYALLASWKRREADYLKSLILDFASAGRRDAARGQVRRPDIHICSPLDDGTERYEIILGDDISRHVPSGRGIHSRSLRALRVARTAYETGVTNLETSNDGSVHFLNTPIRPKTP